MTQQTPTTWNKNSIFRPFIKTVESGAQTTIFCAVEVFCYFQRISHYIFINNRVSHLLPWCFCSRRALRASQADTIQTAGSFQRSFSVSSMKYTFDMNDAYLSSGMTHVWHALHFNIFAENATKKLQSLVAFFRCLGPWSKINGSTFITSRASVISMIQKSDYYFSNSKM